MKTNPIGYYNDGSTILPPNKIKISPSRLVDFLESTHTWFRELILDEDGFTGNTGSCIGNIIHYAAECTANSEPIDEQAIVEYTTGLPTKLDKYNPMDNLDPAIVERSYPDMLPLIIDYVNDNPPESTEGYLWKQMSPNVVLAGSYDALKLNPMSGKRIVIDYKSTASKLPPKTIEFKHKLQAYCYAWLLKQDGIEVDAIEIVYITRYHPGVVSVKTGKTGRDYQPTITSLQVSFDQSNYDFIEQIIKLTAETLEYFIANPDSAYIVFRDYRLKGHDFSKVLRELTTDGEYDDF